MSIGSGLFSKMLARLTHLVKPGGGFQGEFFDLRKDIAATLSPLVAVAVEEFTTPVAIAALATGALHAAANSTAAAVTYAASDLVAAGKTALLQWPRPLTFTSSAQAGGDQTEVPATATITGVDGVTGLAATEVVDLSSIGGANAAGTVTSTHAWKSIVSIVLAAVAGSTGGKSKLAIGAGLPYVMLPTATTVAGLTVKASSLLQTDLAANPRALVITTPSLNAANAPTSATILGADINGLPISETIAVNHAGGGGSVTTVNSFAKVSQIAFSAATATAPILYVTLAEAIGLRKTPKSRVSFSTAGTTFCRREYISGSGAITPTGTITPPVDVSYLTGTVDLTTTDLDTLFSTLAGETLIVTVNGKSATITFTEPTSLADLFAQIDTQGVAGLSASFDKTGKYLQLNASSQDAVTTIQNGAGTANTTLGLASNTTAPSALPYGTYHPTSTITGTASYGVEYEFDATLERDA
jgi:hypothetical protein